MVALSLYERQISKLRAEENPAGWPLERFYGGAWEELIADGIPLDITPALARDRLIKLQAEKLRDGVAKYAAHVNGASAANLKAKGGRPPNDYFKTMILAAAFYRCKQFMPTRSRSALCREAAKELGGRITFKMVADALIKLPRITLDMHGVLARQRADVPADAGVHLIADLLRAMGRELRTTNLEIKAEAEQSEANQKSARHAPVLVFGNGSR